MSGDQCGTPAMQDAAVKAALTEGMTLDQIVKRFPPLTEAVERARVIEEKAVAEPPAPTPRFSGSRSPLTDSVPALRR